MDALTAYRKNKEINNSAENSVVGADLKQQIETPIEKFVDEGIIENCYSHFQKECFSKGTHYNV